MDPMAGRPGAVFMHPHSVPSAHRVPCVPCRRACRAGKRSPATLLCHSCLLGSPSFLLSVFTLVGSPQQSFVVSREVSPLFSLRDMPG